MDSAEGPNIGCTEHTFLRLPSSLRRGINDDFMEDMSKISASCLHTESSSDKTPHVADMGTDTNTASAFAASSVMPPELGSITITSWPEPENRSENHLPILPLPPTIAMWRVLSEDLGRQACLSTDSFISMRHMSSA